MNTSFNNIFLEIRHFSSMETQQVVTTRLNEICFLVRFPFYIICCSFVAFITAFFALGNSMTVEGTIEHTFTDNLIISLNGGEREAIVAKDGSFKILNVSPGTYVLDVLNTQFVYAPVIVTVSEEHGISAKILKDLTGSTGSGLKYPLILRPEGSIPVFAAREGFNLWGMLKNPTVLIMVIGLGLTGLMKLVDPKQIQDAQKEFANSRKQD